MLLWARFYVKCIDNVIILGKEKKVCKGLKVVQLVFCENYKQNTKFKVNKFQLVIVEEYSLQKWNLEINLNLKETTTLVGLTQPYLFCTQIIANN